MQTMQAPETTRVVYGVNELELDLAGKTVHGIWKALEQVFNIPRDAVITVNGARTSSSWRTKSPADVSTFTCVGSAPMAVRATRPSARTRDLVQDMLCFQFRRR